MFKKFAACSVALFVLLAFLVGCSQPPSSTTPSGSLADEKLHVVATTTIVGDVVRNVGGEAISLSVLLPPGMDPHSFQSTPQDMVKVADAHIVFMSGAGLEEFITPLLESAGGKALLVDSSQGIALLEAPVGEEHQAEQGEEHKGGDPHVWMDPNNVMVWVRNIEEAMSKEDPQNAATYRANAQAYLKKLEALDAWARAQVAQVPETNRDLVTDHQVLGYFSARYGFRQVGAVIPGYSTAAEPSAQELAALEDSIRALGVKAVFVGNTVNPSLAERVAGDTGTQLVFMLTGSLTEEGGQADNYLDYMHYNVKAIVEALK